MYEQANKDPEAQEAGKLQKLLDQYSAELAMKDQQIVILQTEKKMLELRAEAAEALKEKAAA